MPRVVYEFRIPEESATEVLGGAGGRDLASDVRIVRVEKEDPTFELLEHADAVWRARGRSLILGWKVRRTYSELEMNKFGLFQLQFPRAFEPAGEECGTRYNYDDACVICGAGRSLDSSLQLKLAKAPNTDFSATIAGDEVIVSERAVQELMDSELSGLKFQQIVDRNRPTSARNLYYQLLPPSSKVSVASPTTAGIHPLDLDERGQYRCPLGHTIGLNLISEIFVRAEDWNGADFVRSREYVGVRRGLLVPRPLLLVSAKMRDVLTRSTLSGWDVEPAHLV